MLLNSCDGLTVPGNKKRVKRGGTCPHIEGRPLKAGGYAREEGQSITAIHRALVGMSVAALIGCCQETKRH